MNNITYFESPQDPFLTSEFIEIIKKFEKIELINWIPTIDWRTIFWSNQKYHNIDKQYLLNENIDQPSKYFYMKDEIPYEEVFKKYHMHFRNQVRKAEKNWLIYEIIDTPSIEQINQCYEIYDQNMSYLQTFSFDKTFFQLMCKISFGYLILIKLNNETVSFGLMLGNFLFIQSSTKQGKKLCANNMVYDTIFKICDNQKAYLWISSINNKWLTLFKKNAWLIWIPAKATFFDLSQHMPGFLRHNKLVWFILRSIDKKKILKHVLPY